MSTSSRASITVRHAKFDRMRLVPLHPSVTAELRDYATTRDRLCPTPSVDRFFVSVTGRRAASTATPTRVFREITELDRVAHRHRPPPRP